MWHADGFDKLKPFGFAIHGCIDGYLRRIMWLKVSYSNNCPEIIASYYLQCVSSLKACPTLLRTDCGTENGHMAAMQVILRRHHFDAQAANSHRYGSSISNQRIECWWSFFRKGRISFLIGLFKGLVDCGHLDLHDSLDIACLRYAFMGYVEHELHLVTTYWNTHRIRNSPLHPSPGGIPDEMFYLPEKYETTDYSKEVDPEKLTHCAQYATEPVNTTGSADHDEYLDNIAARLHLRRSGPYVWEDALRLFFILKDVSHNGR